MAKKGAKKAAPDTDLLDDDDDSTWKTHEHEDGSVDFNLNKPEDDVNNDSNLDVDDPKPKKKAKKVDPEDEEDDSDDYSDVDTGHEKDESDDDEDDSDDDSDDDEDDDDDSDEDDDIDSDLKDKGDSKNYMKRVMRERRLKTEAEAREAEAVDKVYGAEMRSYEDRKTMFDTIKEMNEDRIKGVTEDIKRAKEEEDREKETELQVKLTEAISKRSDIERSITSNKEPEKPKHIQHNPAAQRWIDRNRWYQDKGKFSAEIRFTRSIDTDMGLEKGWEGRVGTPEYFNELDKRIRESIPGLRVRIKKEYGKKKKSKVLAVNRGNNVSVRTKTRRGNGKITLDKDAVANMEEFGLTTVEERKAYAETVNKRLKEEEREKRGGKR